jgi:hypothetical protein
MFAKFKDIVKTYCDERLAEILGEATAPETVIDIGHFIHDLKQVKFGRRPNYIMART